MYTMPPLFFNSLHLHLSFSDLFTGFLSPLNLVRLLSLPLATAFPLSTSSLPLAAVQLSDPSLSLSLCEALSARVFLAPPRLPLSTARLLLAARGLFWPFQTDPQPFGRFSFFLCLFYHNWNKVVLLSFFLFSFSFLLGIDVEAFYFIPVGE